MIYWENEVFKLISIPSGVVKRGWLKCPSFLGDCPSDKLPCIVSITMFEYRRADGKISLVYSISTYLYIIYTYMCVYAKLSIVCYLIFT